MSSEQITRIKNYAMILNTGITTGDLLDFTVNEVVDRVLLYLNETNLDINCERIVAKIVAGVFAQNSANSSGNIDHEISSMSDNGQSINYSDKVKSYLISADDTELFGGFSKLLSRYRRVNVGSE